MTIVNRLIALALGLGLLVLAIVVTAEVALGLLDREPWLVDGQAVDTTLSALRWADGRVLVAAAAALVVGVILLVAQLTPRPPVSLRLRDDRANRVARVERRSLAGCLAEAAREDPEVTGASARVGRRRARIDARVIRGSDRRRARDRVLRATAAQLDGLGLIRPPRVQVRTAAGQERTR